MITLVNYENSDSLKKYNFIFEKGWNDLNKRNELLPEDKQPGQTQFTDLGTFFAYLQNLVAIDPVYVMLPADEAPFEIDANLRTIKVPKDFSNCSGVIRDNYAEIITFTIDRYFDYQDLSNTQIAVQWKSPSGQQGISFIDLIDLETLKDKHQIRFGWPLTEEMLDAAGNLEFSVRFYSVSGETDAQGEPIFNYVLNTTSAVIPVKSTLNVKFNDMVNVVHKVGDWSEFKKYITNSPNPSLGIPTTVTFYDSLPAMASLTNNTLTLSAFADTPDRGNLTYEWIYESSDSTKEKIVMTQESLQKSELKDVYEITTGTYEYKPIEWPSKRPNNTFWYYPEGSDHLMAFPENEPWPSDSTQVTLYSKGTQLTILDTTYEDINGFYYVIAYNTKGTNQVKAMNGPCLLPEPDDIQVITDLPDNKILDKQITLTVTTKKDTKNTARTYKLINKDEGNKVINTIVSTPESNAKETEEASFVVDKCGTYYVTIAAEKNRKSSERNVDNANECLVVENAIIPGIKSLQIANSDTGEVKVQQNKNDYIQIESNVTDRLTLIVNAYTAADEGKKYETIITDGDKTETKEFTVSKYNTAANLSYKWQVAVKDSSNGYVDIANAPANIIADNATLDGNSLKINVLGDYDPSEEITPVYTYKCIVTNSLDEEKNNASTKEFLFYII